MLFGGNQVEGVELVDYFVGCMVEQFEYEGVDVFEEVILQNKYVDLSCFYGGMEVGFVF